MKASTGMVECTGGDDCPMCRMFGKPAAQRTMFTVLDRKDGKVKVAVMDQAKADELLGKVQPKGFCLRLRAWRLEVRFWWMWRWLPLSDRRSGTTTEFEFWMSGPWEFRRYWRG